MKRIIILVKDRLRLLLLLGLVALVVLFVSCEKAAKDEPWGFSFLYMPQAIVQSGGFDNNYYVQLNKSVNSDTSIVVGLYRSGLAPLEDVTVDLRLDRDTLNFLLDQGNNPEAPSKFRIYKNAVAMDESYYDVPSNLYLTNENRENYDFITIHKDLIFEDPVPDGTKFILPLRISNPSKYELYKKNEVTIFIFELNN